MKSKDNDRTNSPTKNVFSLTQNPAALDRVIPATAPASSYRNIHQGKATNALARIDKTATPAQIDLYGNATIIKDDFRLSISDYTKIIGGIKPTAMLLHDTFVELTTETGQPLVKITLADYMEKRGLKDVKETRRQVKADMEALKRIKIGFRDTRRGKTHGDYLNVALAGGTEGIKNGVIIFRFNQDFHDVLKSYPIMPYPQEIYRLNPRLNPNSFYFLRRITEHKNMNIDKPNENTISVKTLLESTPELPKYEEVKAGGRQVEQRILDPFTRDMEAITSFRWHYCGTNGAQVEEPDNYADFEKSLIHIEWVDYPDQTKRIAAKAKRAAAARRKKSKDRDQGDLFNGES